MDSKILHETYPHLSSVDVDSGEIIIQSYLGGGGSGDVYKATFRGTEVVVKVLNDTLMNNTAAIKQFKFESAVMWYVS